MASLRNSRRSKDFIADDHRFVYILTESASSRIRIKLNIDPRVGSLGIFVGIAQSGKEYFFLPFIKIIKYIPLSNIAEAGFC